MIYLDNAATTKPFESVINITNEIMKENYGNPSSLHMMGINAEKVIRDAKKVIANKLNVDIKLLIDDVDNNKDSMNDTKLALYNQLEQLNEQESQDVMKYIEFIKSKK
jgi:cysteine sulfinate desulfinase/cysteine desulfurase-like protein